MNTTRSRRHRLNELSTQNYITNGKLFQLFNRTGAFINTANTALHMTHIRMIIFNTELKRFCSSLYRKALHPSEAACP